MHDNDTINDRIEAVEASAQFVTRHRSVGSGHATAWTEWAPCTVSDAMALLIYGGRTVRITIPEGDGENEVEYRAEQAEDETRDYSDPRLAAAYELIDALRARLGRYEDLIDGLAAGARRVEQVRRLAERLGRSSHQVDRVIIYVLRDALVVEVEPS